MKLQLRPFAFDECHNLVCLGNDKFLLRAARPVHLNHIDRGRIAKPEGKTRIGSGCVASARDNVATLPLSTTSKVRRCTDSVPPALRPAYPLPSPPFTLA